MSEYPDTMTLTFGDVAENHAGMQQIGSKASEGFTNDELNIIRNNFEKNGYLVETIDLIPKKSIGKLEFESASILLIKNGVDALLPKGKTATDLHKEQASLEHDTKAFMYGRVVNKRARYNLCFSEKSQKPDYVHKKGRVIAFDDVPLTNHIREHLVSYMGKKTEHMQLEGNYYYDKTKCGIGFHGDTERRLVIGIRLGATLPLHYRWFYKNKDVKGIEPFVITPEHGDIYVMSDKATGYDWKSSSKPTLRHAAGCNKFLQVKYKKT